MSSTERRHRVLYFSVVPIGDESNGGQLVCREHVQRLAASSHMELYVCTAGDATCASANAVFARAQGAEFHHITLHPHATRNVALPWLVPRLRWPFTFEVIAQYHTYVERAFLEHAKAVAPDVVVIDYLFSALFIPRVFDLPVRRILVSLNNESDFFADQCRLGRNNAGTSRSAIARLRLARFERAVCVKSDRVVALSINDLPSDIARASSTRIIPPALDASPMRWSPSREASLFFVGNVAHYPNFLAIKWLAEEFAPALAEVMPGARIRIVGAAAADVAEAWRRSNIEFLGKSDAETVKTLFATSTLFIAPIENAFGSKMKVLQCLSHATPVLASAAALSGLPFEGVIPLLRLDDPRAAAETAKRLMTNPAPLVDLSARLAREHAAFVARSESAWDELIVAACRSPARRAPSRGLASAIDWLLDVPDSPRRPGYSEGVAGASAALTT